MDILNFISWIRGGRVVNTVNPNKTLIPVGLKDPKRDDDYLAGAISVADFAAQVGGLQTVAVDGVTITGDGTPGDPLVASTPAPPYKVYTAILTQSGTNAPVATVLQNTLGGNVTFSRIQAGQYSINSSNLFGNTSPYIVLGSNRTGALTGGTVSTLITRYGSSSNIDLWSMNAALNSFIEGFGAINNVSIEIRVYS